MGIGLYPKKHLSTMWTLCPLLVSVGARIELMYPAPPMISVLDCVCGFIGFGLIA